MGSCCSKVVDCAFNTPEKIVKSQFLKMAEEPTGPKAAAYGPAAATHNMSTAVDKDAIRQAYDDVRSDTKETEWAVFKFDQSNKLGVTATGKSLEISKLILKL